MKIAVFGDVHNSFSQADLEYFAGHSYPVYLFVGDLGKVSFSRTQKTIGLINRIVQKPNSLFVMPGNHDGPGFFMLAGELFRWEWLQKLFLPRTLRHIGRITEILSNGTFGGYSFFPFPEFTLLLSRPFSMGSRVNYPPLMETLYGVRDYRGSVRMYKKILDQIRNEHPEKPVVILAHNGPKGCGHRKDDLWGSDFTRKIRDWGEIDLKLAIQYGKKIGLEIPAVVGGHMHRTPVQPDRRDILLKEGTLYLNAADVPRITQGKHSFYELEISGGMVHARRMEFGQ